MKRFILFFICFLFGSASAQISLCNERPDSLLLAIGVELQDEIFVFGWHHLASGACLPSLQSALNQRGRVVDKLDRVWIHGRDRLSAPTREVGGGSEFCVDDVFDVFRAEFADSTCEKRGYIRAAFSEISFSGNQRDGLVVLSNQGIQFSR